MGDPLNPDCGVEAIDLVGIFGSVCDDAAEAHVIILRLRLDRGDNPVHREDRVEIIGGHDQGAFGMLERCREAAADDVAQDVEDHDVGIFQKMVLFQQLDRLTDDIAAATGAGRRTTGLHAHHAIIALEHVIFGPQFLAVEIHLFENIDDRRDQ